MRVAFGLRFGSISEPEHVTSGSVDDIRPHGIGKYKDLITDVPGWWWNVWSIMGTSQRAEQTVFEHTGKAIVIPEYLEARHPAVGPNCSQW